MPKIKITFLGTGPAGRIPRPGCVKPACRDARKPGSKSRRLQSSVLIRSGTHALLFDATEDILKQWHHAGRLPKLDAVFISHPHGDAMGGVHRLGEVLKKIGQPRAPLLAERLTLKHIHAWNAVPKSLDEHATAPGMQVRQDPFTIVPFRIQHTFDPLYPTLGFDIRVGSKRIVLMSDVKTVAPAILRRLQGPDLCIIDCAMHTRQMPSHVNLEEALGIVRALKPKRTLLTQIGVDWPPYLEARRIARQHGLDIAHDGLVLQLFE